MQEVEKQCSKNNCNYSGNEHGLKTHLAISHEDTKYGRVNLSCDTCGKEFSRPQWKVKSGNTFCSQECKNRYNKEQRRCTVCGTTKIVDKSAYKHKNGWVCSTSCNKSQYRKEVSCIVCGDTHMELKKRERKFPYRCSTECTKEWLKVETSCAQCGDTYIENRHQTRRYENTYCSNDCFYDSQRGDRCENSKHQWWAHQVKERENNTCEDCGASYDVMCAHHDPPREELSKEQQTNVENGVCLCYPCHADRHEGGQREVLLSWWEWYNSKK